MKEENKIFCNPIEFYRKSHGLNNVRETNSSDRKIERAGGREIVSRSRSTRNKRNSKSDLVQRPARAGGSQDNDCLVKPNTFDSLHSPITRFVL